MRPASPTPCSSRPHPRRRSSGRSIVERGYRIIAFPFHEAFALRALAQEENRPAADGVLREEYIYDAVIPAACYCIDPPMPPQAIPTLGMRLLIVGARKQNPDVVERLLDAVFTTRIAKLVRPPLDVRRMETAPELPWHPGALRYIRRDQPLLTGQLIEELANFFTIAAPTAASLVFLRQWFRQRGRLRRERSFEWYIGQVTEVELEAMELEAAGEYDAERLIDLQRELGRLKTEALRRFTEGRLEGEPYLSSFLAHVGDARSHLTRISRHHRDGPVTGDGPSRPGPRRRDVPG